MCKKTTKSDSVAVIIINYILAAVWIFALVITVIIMALTIPVWGVWYLVARNGCAP